MIRRTRHIIERDTPKIVKVLNQLMVVMIGLMFYSAIFDYIAHKEYIPIQLKHFMVVVIAMAVLILALDGPNRQRNLARPIFKWLALYWVVSLIWGGASIAISGTFGEAAIDQFKQNTLTFFYFSSFCILLYERSSFQVARKLVIYVAIFSVGVNIYDFISFDVKEFSIIPGRAAGFYLNANKSGIVLCFAYLMTIDLVRSYWKPVYTIWLFLGIVLTQSRGSIGMYSFLVLATLMRGRYTLPSLLAFGTVVGISVFIAFNYLLKDYQKDLLKYADSFNNIIERVDNVMAGSSGSVKEGRVMILYYYVNLYKEKPITGHGMGASLGNEVLTHTGPISSHNLFLNLMVDYGIMGGILILLFVWSIVSYNGHYLYYWEGVFFPIMFLAFAFTSHNLFDYTCHYYIYALYGRLIHMRYEEHEPMLGQEYAMMKVA